MKLVWFGSESDGVGWGTIAVTSSRNVTRGSAMWTHLSASQQDSRWSPASCCEGLTAQRKFIFHCLWMVVIHLCDVVGWMLRSMSGLHKSVLRCIGSGEMGSQHPKCPCWGWYESYGVPMEFGLKWWANCGDRVSHKQSSHWTTCRVHDCVCGLHWRAHHVLWMTDNCVKLRNELYG